MEPAVDKLEALFQKAESDLNYISLRLETEFSQQFLDKGQEQLNPIKLLQRINQAKVQFKNLSEQASQIHSQQQEIQAYVRNQILACQDLLCHSQKCAGLMVMEKSDDERFLQTSVSSIRKDTASSELSTDEEDKENKSEGTESKTQQESDIKPVNRGKHEFVPVDEREFLTVSELVRGRVKLQDVNKFQSNSQRLDKNGTEGYWSNWRSKVKGS
ncbi:spindle and kinetochore-associated protein 2-like isoform X2 [Stylophora pistillata]|uniref:spindle and kinetochore-associated protein 2-like isoform X2 n=1 Tax=Stylophora pistillata TaxID=50429 RepID=UPI000C0493E3|nr:spindle and kinetochore-associated protein 2-like isoform X2 [Stylophora pistillata]